MDTSETKVVIMGHIDLIELLENAHTYANGLSEPVVKALRAVVELHKPSLEDFFKEIGCMGCGINSEYAAWQEEYPCPTIQAIEKELR